MESVGSQFQKLIDNDSIKEVTIEFGEIFVDSVLNDGLLKDIPFINSVVIIKSIGLSVFDSFLVKKVLRFAQETNKIDKEIRNKFFSGLSPETRTRIAEKTLHLLNQAEDEQKAEFQASLLKSLIYLKCSTEEYSRFCFVLENVYTADIIEFKEMHLKGPPKNVNIMSLMHSYGLSLAAQGTDSLTGLPETKNEYYFSDLGNKFVNCAFPSD